MKEVEIIDYEDIYHDDLKKLSFEWLLKYDLLEPEDEKILNNPKEVVLKDGGYIFFAKYKEEIIGTVSLFKTDESTFEIAKLAVAEKYQGLHIGKKLMDKCLSVAKKEDARKVILYTNHKLISAISLYKKYNFKEVKTFNSSRYEEADMEMELSI